MTITFPQLLQECWTDNRFKLFLSLEEIFQRREKKQTFSHLLCYLCVALQRMSGSFDLLETHLLYWILYLLLRVVNKWRRNGFPKWKMNHTEEFKMKSYCEFLSYPVNVRSKIIAWSLLMPTDAALYGGWGMGSNLTPLGVGLQLMMCFFFGLLSFLLFSVLLMLNIRSPGHISKVYIVSSISYSILQ